MSVVLAIGLAGCGGDDDRVAPTEEPRETRASSPTRTAEQLLQVLAQNIPGFTTSDARAISGGAAATFTSAARTSDGSQVVVLVQVSGCDPFICGTLDPSTYQSAEAQRNLKSTLSTVHIENPALTWEFGTAELGPAAKGLYTYALSYVETKDSAGGTTRTSANSYRAWYHDGATLIVMEVSTRGGDFVRSAAELKQRMSRTEAEEAAKAVFAALSPQLFR